MNRPPQNFRFSGDDGNRQALRLFIVFSLFIHLLFFSAALLLIKGGNHHVVPYSYMVNLVSPDSNAVSSGDASRNYAPPKNEEFKTDIKKLEERGHSIGKPVDKIRSHSSREEELVSERIDAIKAKKKIEQVAALRNIISLQVGKKSGQKDTGGKGGGSPKDDYYSKITSEIWQHWIYPDMGSKDMEAIVVIKILKDGSVQIKGVEKSSGNSLFDRSAIRAITKASPLTPPPYEMEIGVRFYP